MSHYGRSLSFFLALLPVIASAQPKEMHESITINDALYLRVNMVDSMFEYCKTLPPADEKMHGAKSIFHLLFFREDANLYVPFFNPLKNYYSLEQKELPDPNVESINKFLATLLPALNSITVPEEKTANDKSDKVPMPFAADVKLKDDSCPEEIRDIKSPEFLSIVIWLYSQKKSPCGAKRDEIVTQLAKVDKNLFAFETDANKLFEDMMNFNLDDTSPDSALADAIKDYEKRIKDLETLNNTFMTPLEDIEKLMALDNTTPFCCALQKVFLNSTKAYITRMAPIVEDRKKMIEAFKGLKKTFTDVNRNMRRLSDKKFYIHFKLEAAGLGKIKEYTLKFFKRDITGENKIVIKDEKLISSLKMEIRQFQVFTFDFSPGAAYTNLSYPKYTVDEVDGKKVVGQGAPEDVNVVATGMLDIIPNIPWQVAVYPVGQIGVGTGKSLPTFLYGAGLLFITGEHPVSVTIGKVLTFQKDLSGKKIGDPVADANELDQSLKYRLMDNTARKNAFYFGVQIGL